MSVFFEGTSPLRSSNPLPEKKGGATEKISLVSAERVFRTSSSDNLSLINAASLTSTDKGGNIPLIQNIYAGVALQRELNKPMTDLASHQKTIRDLRLKIINNFLKQVRKEQSWIIDQFQEPWRLLIDQCLLAEPSNHVSNARLECIEHHLPIAVDILVLENQVGFGEENRFSQVNDFLKTLKMDQSNEAQLKEYVLFLSKIKELQDRNRCLVNSNLLVLSKMELPPVVVAWAKKIREHDVSASFKIEVLEEGNFQLEETRKSIDRCLYMLACIQRMNARIFVDGGILELACNLECENLQNLILWAIKEEYFKDRIPQARKLVQELRILSVEKQQEICDFLKSCENSGDDLGMIVALQLRLRSLLYKLTNIKDVLISEDRAQVNPLHRSKEVHEYLTKLIGSDQLCEKYLNQLNEFIKLVDTNQKLIDLGLRCVKLYPELSQEVRDRWNIIIESQKFDLDNQELKQMTETIEKAGSLLRLEKLVDADFLSRPSSVQNFVVNLKMENLNEIKSYTDSLILKNDQINQEVIHLIRKSNLNSTYKKMDELVRDYQKMADLIPYSQKLVWLKLIQRASHLDQLHKRLDIISLENSAGVQRENRFREVHLAFDHLKKVPKGFFGYTEHLKDIILEEGVGYETVPRFVQLDDHPIFMKVNDELGRGSFGIVNQVEAKFFKQSIETQVLAYKTNTNVSTSTAEEDTLHQKLWLKCSEDERKYILEWIGPHLTHVYEGTINSAHQLSAQKKNVMTRSLFKSMKVLLDKRFVLCDIKGSNMLYRYTKHSEKAVLSDFGSLEDFDEIIEHPTPEKLLNFYRKLNTWTPQDLPLNEYINLRNNLKSLIEMSDLESRKQELIDMHANIQQIMKFNLAVTLYKFQTSRDPYPLHLAKDIMGCPSHLTKDFELPNKKTEPYMTVLPTISDYHPHKMLDDLEKAGCEVDLANLIVELLNPDPEQRTYIYLNI